MRIADSALDLIGNTPLVRLTRLCAEHGVQDVLAKLEKNNPAGSSKDRVALSMLMDAEARGLLRAGARIVEPTSGNTGVGLAMVAALRGYRLTLTMPENMSLERRRLLAAYGAELVLTPAKEGMEGAVRRAREILDQDPAAFMPSQFDNPANPAAHAATVGTGGTLCGTGRALKAAKPGMYVAAVEPAESPLLSGGRPGPHGIQGIGANFVPGNYDAAVVDEVLTVSTEEALDFARQLARREGLLCGISSGAAVCAALRLAARPEFAGRTIVTLLPDTGERYLSAPGFVEEDNG